MNAFFSALKKTPQKTQRQAHRALQNSPLSAFICAIVAINLLYPNPIALAQTTGKTSKNHIASKSSTGKLSPSTQKSQANKGKNNNSNKKTDPNSKNNKAKTASTASHLNNQKTSASTQPVYHNRVEVKNFAHEVAMRHGFDEKNVLTILEKAKYQPTAARAIVPPSKPGARHWERYRARYVESVRINNGLAFWEANAAILNKTTEKTGVPPEVIVAILGIETIFGQHTGGFRTVDALSTLTFDFPRNTRDRSDFFRGELEAFFLLSRENRLNPLEVKGSFAGAIGMGQFMPSSWRRFAVDGDDDGEIDLFHSVQDTVASIGNFLKVHGWQAGEFWYVPATVKNNLNTQQSVEKIIKEGIIPRFTDAQLRELGIVGKFSEYDIHLRTNEMLCLVDLPNALESVEYRLAGRNYYAVSRYNRSNFYAMSVLDLATALRQAYTKKQQHITLVQAGKTPVER